ncbi:MAG: acyl-CoA thioesterase [Parvularculaceae bacterium]|nr:acyl-CoA thioesterase [Parvularculaceae bacterium]
MTSREDFAFLHPLRVRWNECDAQGVVFNVNFPLYYDVAVWEWTRALGYPSWREAPEFVTARVECDYRGPAFFDDKLDVGVRAARFGGKSFRVACAVFREDALLNEGAITYVYVRKGTRESEPVPQEFKDRATAFERVTPEAR